MYYDIFDSYEQAQNEATTFQIVVALSDGGFVESSPIPMPAMPSVRDDILATEQTGAWFSLWNRHDNALTSIPPFQIKTIKLVLR